MREIELNMPVRDLDHIGLAVRSIDQAERFYSELLGLIEASAYEMPSMGLKCKFFQMGNSLLELMEPLGDEGPVQSHLKHYGPGVQHIAIRIGNFDKVVENLRHQVKWAVSEPEVINGRTVTFVHPAISGGVVVELIRAQPKP